MKCFHPLCPVDPGKGGTLYRVNDKGLPAIWACRIHIKNTDATITPEVEQIVKIIEQK